MSASVFERTRALHAELADVRDALISEINQKEQDVSPITHTQDGLNQNAAVRLWMD